MRYSQLCGLAILASLATCPARAAVFDVRYINPGTLTFDALKFEVDGQPYVELPSGCPGPGTVEAGPTCIAQIQLGEGLHQVRAQAYVAGGEEPAWTVFSNTINVRGAPEPKASVGIGLGLAWLAALGRRRRP